MDTSAYVRAAVEQTDTLADWVDGKDAAIPVPTCPEWTLADLVDHVGGVQRMVTMLVGDRLIDPTPAFAGAVPGPTDPAEWRAWLTGCAAEVRQAYSSVSDDTPVWDPSGAAAGVPFWARRVFGEVCVHRADAAAALGLPYELAPDLAVAALADWLATMTSRGYWDNVPRFAEAMRGDGQTLRFRATDAPGDWLARREQDGVVLEQGGGEADVTVSGPATDLLLVITRRRALDAAPALDVQGDRALFEHWVDHMDWVAG
ncbi:maleylpyruvate isomerase family mycothiol-dependent enzyme [Nonomuraea sp. NPDC049419]|uniref:maleylpyruvate isomerase family mycothiol-dependent enzyme n=1 Tax=Nonomuraea sp. NPDC049419 TaxID=3155772 RepID=UPI0034472057